MSVKTATMLSTAMAFFMVAAVVMAQDDFESLLKDISQPVAETSAPPAVNTDTNVVSTEPVPAEAPAVEQPAVSESPAAAETVSQPAEATPETAPVAAPVYAPEETPTEAAPVSAVEETVSEPAAVMPESAPAEVVAEPTEVAPESAPEETVSEPIVTETTATTTTTTTVTTEETVTEPATTTVTTEETVTEPATTTVTTEETVTEPVTTTTTTEETETVTEPTTTTVTTEEAVTEPAPESQESYLPEESAEQPAPSEEETQQVEQAVEETPEAPAETMEPAAVEEEQAPVAEEAGAEQPAAEEAVAGEGEAGAPADAATAMLMAQQEEVRRQANEVQGRKDLDAGLEALSAKDYDTAIKHLEEASAKIPVRPATQDVREKTRVNLGEAYYRKALEIVKAHGDMTQARKNAELAKKTTPENKDVASLLKRIQDEEDRQAKIAARPIPPKDRPEVVAKNKTIAQLMTEARQYYEIGDYNNAEGLCDQVLLQDEYNVDAMRYLRKIDEVRYYIKTKEREATEADMIQKVRDTWNPPIRQDIKLPEGVEKRGAVITETSAQRLQKKMESIIIPSIEFRQANITDVVNFLVDASVAGDPEGQGVNIILNLNIPGAEVSAPAPTPAPTAEGTPFDEFGGLEAQNPEAPMPGASSIPTITLNLRRISLMDAIKYITEVAQLKFRLEENAVMITPAGVVSGRVVTRLYPVQPSILDVIIQKEDEPEKSGEFIQMGGKVKVQKSDVKDFFERAGVPFPVGTSITYNSSISQLIVANTPENLESFERILSRLNVVPNQVEIEARFVEIAQDDLEELGLQWIFTDNYELAQKEGDGPIAGRERIQVNKNENGVSQALRFFNVDKTTGAVSPLTPVTRNLNQSPLGNILTFASVLTNPELQVVIQAISQHGGSDLLSAPRVTTRSGVNAQIQVVTEIIYPTEFEVTQPTISASTVSTGTGVGGGLVTPPTVTPGSFQTRETGVILNVTPTVGPDGYTIDLTLAPEVAELIDWIQYGSKVSAGGQDFTYNIPQPVFTSRNVTTSIVIWDGQTVVMGGLIREDLVKVKDKIPILGDIPLLGRLFRSEGQASKKKNLLIFVSARLVDPAGKPIHRETAPGTSVTEAAPMQGTATVTATP